jgi:hypothetical protein
MNTLGKRLSLHWSRLGPSYNAVFMFRPRLSIFILDILESEVQYIVSSIIVAYNVKDCKPRTARNCISAACFIFSSTGASKAVSE